MSEQTVNPATMEAARAAKTKFIDQFGEIDEINGIGIALLDEGTYGVKVNLREATDQTFPTEIDGVPIVLDIVGTIPPL